MTKNLKGIRGPSNVGDGFRWKMYVSEKPVCFCSSYNAVTLMKSMFVYINIIYVVRHMTTWVYWIKILWFLKFRKSQAFTFVGCDSSSSNQFKSFSSCSLESEMSYESIECPTTWLHVRQNFIQSQPSSKSKINIKPKNT